MRKILFVDDDAQILEGLRDAFRSRRREWDMTFREGADAALAQLEKEPFDVVVSDLGMPGIDGAELLEQVRERRPEAVRILMSGSVELDVLARATGAAHRLLSKPCDVDELGRVVERSVALHELTRRETLRRAATGVAALPGVPDTYRRIAVMVDDPETTAVEAAPIVERDPALAAKVLQLANSAFFARTVGVASVERAVGRIGLRALSALALSAGSFGAFPAGKHLSLVALQDHGVRVARLASQILPAGPARDDAFAAGLLHDIGLLVLAMQEPDYLAETLDDAARDGRPLAEVEYERRGVGHAEVGAHLLALWGLPDAVVEAVAFHHRPQAVPAPALDAVAAVAIAEVLAHEQQTELPAESPPLAADYLARIGAAEQIGAWRNLSG